MAEPPKSFWGGGVVDPETSWVSEYDEIGLRAEADIIRLSARAGIPLVYAEQMELWEIAAALNLDLVETVQTRTIREIDEKQKAYYEETKEQREMLMVRQAERRRERKAGR